MSNDCSGGGAPSVELVRHFCCWHWSTGDIHFGCRLPALEMGCFIHLLADQIESVCFCFFVLCNYKAIYLLFFWSIVVFHRYVGFLRFRLRQN